MSGWQPIETAPKNIQVLVGGINQHGKPYWAVAVLDAEDGWLQFDPWA